jgi:hypothetical protein
LTACLTALMYSQSANPCRSHIISDQILYVIGW